MGHKLAFLERDLSGEVEIGGLQGWRRERGSLGTLDMSNLYVEIG